MTRWTHCGEAFIAGDVVRWTEPVWAEKGRRKKKLVKVGTRRMTAEVLSEDGKDFVHLKVLKCEIVSSLAARPVEPAKKGELVRRKRKTIGKGSGERLKWSEESARSLAVSKFVS
jgi:hypothetical protein